MKKNLLVLFLFMLVACKNQPHNITDTININIDVNNVDSINLNNCKSIQLLQNGQNAIFGPVTKMVMDEDIIAISANNRLSIFDSEGELLTYISNKGNASYEYQHMTDYWIDNDHIFVYDINGKKILKYSLQNKLVKKFELPQMISDEYVAFDYLLPFEDGYIGKCVWNGSLKKSPALAYYDKQFKLIKTFNDVMINCGLRLGYPLFDANKEVLYWNALDNVIYSITNHMNIFEKYRISFGNSNFPSRNTITDDYELLDLYMNDEEWRTKHAGLIAYVWQKDNKLIFTYMFNNNPHLVIYNPINNQVINYRIDVSDYIVKQWSFDGSSVFILGETDDKTELFKIYSLDSN